jgi:LysM repeat protein
MGLVVAAGCGSATSGSAASTELTIERQTGSPSTVLQPSTATLRCGRTAAGTGFLRDAAKPACGLVGRGAVQKVAAAQRNPGFCTQVYGGPQTARITGTIHDRRVDVTVNRTDGCGTADWRSLAELLGDPERVGTISASEAASSATTTTAPPITYVVKRGDTLTSIARHFGITVTAIVNANHLPNANQLTAGQSLTIPPVPPPQIVVTPAAAPVGADFAFTLTGAQPSEVVTFEIDSPDGKYTGPPHAASAQGEVTATYQNSMVSSAGTYTVVAKGNRGTTARADFQVQSATTSSTTAPAGAAGSTPSTGSTP